ncbi:MAG: hypothetical protein H0V17_07570 [Deltaproteobacteria bacterium]|nr:hypothetical protein [Deltaproteobacteria bacterium]
MTRLAPLLVVAFVGQAHADGTGLQDPANRIQPEPPPPPSPADPIVDHAASHGLESTSRHQGFNFTAALGGGLTVGIDISGSVGRGPAGSFRFAHTASEQLAFTAELISVTLIRQIKGTDGSNRTETDQGSGLLLGTQFYVNRSLWLRLAAGISSMKFDDNTLVGPTGLAGGGVDILRFRRVAIGVEMMSIGQINRDGLLTTTAFMLDVSIE